MVVVKKLAIFWLEDCDVFRRHHQFRFPQMQFLFLVLLAKLLAQYEGCMGRACGKVGRCSLSQPRCPTCLMLCLSQPQCCGFESWCLFGKKRKKRKKKKKIWKDACIRKGSLKAIVIQIDFHVIVVTERRQFNVLLLIDWPSAWC